MAYRAMGAYNGDLPVATGIVVQHMTDPANMPYLNYTQLVPIDTTLFSYWKMNPDDPTRLTDVNSYAWGYDDVAPSGEGFKPEGQLVPDRVARWAFPYQIGDTTLEMWNRGTGVDMKAYLDQMRLGHAHLHRATRLIAELANASWGSNTSSLNTLLGTSGVGFDLSSGTELDPTNGNPNPNFQCIKRAFNLIKRRIHLSTNSALKGDELICVLPPVVAQAMSISGEIVNFIKQSVLANQLMSPNIVNWNLPDYYGGFKLVVEDTPRCFIKTKADGTTTADVTIAAQKDYALSTDTVYFLSRPGQLKGIPGAKSFSTLQLYHKGPAARVQAFSDPENELTRGRIVLEDQTVIPSLVSGFALTDVLT